MYRGGLWRVRGLAQRATYTQLASSPHGGTLSFVDAWRANQRALSKMTFALSYPQGFLSGLRFFLIVLCICAKDETHTSPLHCISLASLLTVTSSV